MSRKSVLVTGANGYIGNAVAKAFRRAGWITYGLIRREADADDLARHEIHPLIGSPTNLAFLRTLENVPLDVLVSNTEDPRDLAAHFSQVRTMVQALMERDVQNDRKSLFMFTSGCKDYGPMKENHGDPNLKPHTEASDLNPPASLIPRCEFGASYLAAARSSRYDAVVLRPTIVYGHSSSHYGDLFKLAASSGPVLRLNADSNAVMHSLHVDDCAEAYVALAEHPRREEVAQQSFNISNARYETAGEVADALAQAYGIQAEFSGADPHAHFNDVQGLANFSQWVGSQKIRDVTGWTERRPTFVEGIREYRLAYEAFNRIDR